MNTAEQNLRHELVERCREMNARGINQKTSGTIPVRFGDRMLMSPSAMSYDMMKPETVASIPLAPSMAWRFHHKFLCERPDAGAVELETIAKQRCFTLLSDAEVDETIAAFARCGVQGDGRRVGSGDAGSARRQVA